ncbi:MAG: hypothetical protein P9M03_05070 [Candidatus Theseobacter exili]|nr:hypothetical protein [Candidatus Theseobacter exili]
MIYLKKKDDRIVVFGDGIVDVLLSGLVYADGVIIRIRYLDRETIGKCKKT